MKVINRSGLFVKRVRKYFGSWVGWRWEIIYVLLDLEKKLYFKHVFRYNLTIIDKQSRPRENMIAGNAAIL